MDGYHQHWTKGGVVSIAKIQRTHGVEGLLRVRFFQDFPVLRQFVGALLTLSKNSKEESFLLEDLQPYKASEVLARFTGIKSLEQAKPWSGGWILAPKEKLPSLPKGEYYVYQLKGMRVLLEQETIGRVTAVLEAGKDELLLELTLGGAFCKSSQKKEKTIVIPLNKRPFPVAAIEGDSVVVKRPDVLAIL